jgi:hypothetical protein
MAVFPSDSIRTKNWGSEVLTDSDIETQLDLLHAYLQASLNATTGHAHTGATNQGPKLTPANLLIASQATGDLLYASSATAWARLAKGTALYHLTMNSGGTLPEWSAPLANATVAEVKTGTESSKYVAPSTMIGHEGVVKGWISFKGTGTIAIKDSFNVSGIVDDAAALWTVTWDTDFADANYAVVASCINYNHISTVMIKTKAAGSVQIISVGQNGTTTYDNDDLSDVNVIAIGDR